MKTIQTRTAAALLLVAGTIIPAFAQDRNTGHDRNSGRNDRPQQQRDSRGGGRDAGGQQFRQRDSQPQYQQRQDSSPSSRQPRNNQQSYSQPNYSQQNYRDQNYRDQNYRDQNYRGQSYRPQNYRQQDYRPQSNYRNGGASFGFRSGGGVRWADRGGYRGRFIPQNRFYSSFGRDHFFRIGRPVYYNGYSRFSYGGYGFQFIDPVPAYWGSDWYDSDDVYLDYEDDGYYMYNRSYPGVGIAVNIDF